MLHVFFQLPSIRFGCAVPPTPSLYSPAKKRRSLVAVTLKMNLKYTPPENFTVTCGRFECNTYCIMVLEKEESDLI